MKRQVSRKKRKTSTPPIVWDGPVSIGLTLVDALLERIRHNKVRTFDASNIEQLRRLDARELKAVFVHYERSVCDLKLALGGDTFYIEAYSNYTKPQMKVVLEYLKQIHKLKPDETATKKLRVITRKTKQKTPEQIVAKVLFLEYDKETKLTSLRPTVIVGAKAMWVYNTKTRKLGCYYAKGESLSVKGTTVLNYDEKRSLTKMLRKPKEQLNKAMTGTIETFWNAIRAVPQAIPPRLSRETLILRVKPSI